VTAAQFAGLGVEGKALGEAISAERIRRLDALRIEQRSHVGPNSFGHSRPNLVE